MTVKAAFAATAIALLVASPARAALPEPVRAMLEAAFATNDTNAITAVANAARATNPDSIAEIDELVGQRSRRFAAALEAQRIDAGPFEFINGEIEAGASRQTGTTDSVGAYGAVKFTKNGPRWRHLLQARIDYMRTNDLTTTDRITASYEPNYKFDDRLFAYGLALYERDPIGGFDSRLTASGGIGYAVVARPELNINVTGGPAVRKTDYVFLPDESGVAGRASVAVRWRVTPTVNFVNDSALYVEEGNRNATINSALDTQLIGRLKARFSYDIRFEDDVASGVDQVNTLSRATLLYSF